MTVNENRFLADVLVCAILGFDALDEYAQIRKWSFRQSMVRQLKQNKHANIAAEKAAFEYGLTTEYIDFEDAPDEPDTIRAYVDDVVARHNEACRKAGPEFREAEVVALVPYRDDDLVGSGVEFIA